MRLSGFCGMRSAIWSRTHQIGFEKTVQAGLDPLWLNHPVDCFTRMLYLPYSPATLWALRITFAHCLNCDLFDYYDSMISDCVASYVLAWSWPAGSCEKNSSPLIPLQRGKLYLSNWDDSRTFFISSEAEKSVELIVRKLEDLVHFIKNSTKQIVRRWLRVRQVEPWVRPILFSTPHPAS